MLRDRSSSVGLIVGDSDELALLDSMINRRRHRASFTHATFAASISGHVILVMGVWTKKERNDIGWGVREMGGAGKGGREEK